MQTNWVNDHAPEPKSPHHHSIPFMAISDQSHDFNGCFFLYSFRSYILCSVYSQLWLEKWCLQIFTWEHWCRALHDVQPPAAGHFRPGMRDTMHRRHRRHRRISWACVARLLSSNLLSLDVWSVGQFCQEHTHTFDTWITTIWHLEFESCCTFVCLHNYPLFSTTSTGSSDRICVTFGKVSSAFSTGNVFERKSNVRFRSSSLIGQDQSENRRKIFRMFCLWMYEMNWTIIIIDDPIFGIILARASAVGTQKR